MLPVIFKTLFVVALLLLVITFILIARTKKAQRDCCVCVGWIVGFQHSASENMLDDYETEAISPVVRYSVGGRQYEFVGNYYATTMKIGDRVEVLYNRQDASRARLKKGCYLAPGITGAVAAVFILLFMVYSSGSFTSLS